MDHVKREHTGPDSVAAGTHISHLESGLTLPSQPPLRSLGLSHLTEEETESQRLARPRSHSQNPSIFHSEVYAFNSPMMLTTCVIGQGPGTKFRSQPCCTLAVDLGKGIYRPEGFCCCWFGLVCFCTGIIFNIYHFPWQKVTVLHFLKIKHPT